MSWSSIFESISDDFHEVLLPGVRRMFRAWQLPENRRSHDQQKFFMSLSVRGLPAFASRPHQAGIELIMI